MLNVEKISNIALKLNPITFDPPPLAQHFTPLSAQLIFGQNGGKMLFDFNFEAKFGTLSSLNIYKDPI